MIYSVYGLPDPPKVSDPAVYYNVILEDGTELFYRVRIYAQHYTDGTIVYWKDYELCAS